MKPHSISNKILLLLSMACIFAYTNAYMPSRATFGCIATCPSFSLSSTAIWQAQKGVGAGALISENKKVINLYEWDYKLDAGIVLSGTEVKACREGNVQLSDGHADIVGGEAWLMSVHIGRSSRTAAREDHIPKRNRKLLLHAKEGKFICMVRR